MTVEQTGGGGCRTSGWSRRNVAHSALEPFGEQRLDPPFVEPVETSQQPMFDLLGAPAADKRHVIFETGHAVVTQGPMIKEVLDWLDKYLGPVPTGAQ